jgi:hypothetical protein
MTAAKFRSAHYPEDQMQMTESKKLVVLALRHMFRHIAAG